MIQVKIILYISLYLLLAGGILIVVKNLVGKTKKDLVSCEKGKTKDKNGNCVSVCGENLIYNNNTSSSCDQLCIEDCGENGNRCGCNCLSENEMCFNDEICLVKNYCKLKNPHYSLLPSKPEPDKNVTCPYPNFEIANGKFADEVKGKVYSQGDSLNFKCNSGYKLALNKNKTDTDEIDVYCNTALPNADSGQFIVDSISCVTPDKGVEPVSIKQFNEVCCKDGEQCDQSNFKCSICPNNHCSKDGCCPNDGKTYTCTTDGMCCANQNCGNTCCPSDTTCCGEYCCTSDQKCSNGKDKFCEDKCGEDFFNSQTEFCKEITDPKDSSKTIKVVAKKSCSVLQSVVPNNISDSSYIDPSSDFNKYIHKNRTIKTIPTCYDKNKNLYISPTGGDETLTKITKTQSADICASQTKDTCTSGNLKNVCKYDKNTCSHIDKSVCNENNCILANQEVGFEKIVDLGDFSKPGNTCTANYSCNSMEQGGSLYSKDIVFGINHDDCPIKHNNPSFPMTYSKCCQDENNKMTGRICDPDSKLICVQSDKTGDNGYTCCSNYIQYCNKYQTDPNDSSKCVCSECEPGYMPDWNNYKCIKKIKSGVAYCSREENIATKHKWVKPFDNSGEYAGTKKALDRMDTINCPSGYYLSQDCGSQSGDHDCTVYNGTDGEVRDNALACNYRSDIVVDTKNATDSEDQTNGIQSFCPTGKIAVGKYVLGNGARFLKCAPYQYLDKNTNRWTTPGNQRTKLYPWNWDENNPPRTNADVGGYYTFNESPIIAGQDGGGVKGNFNTSGCFKQPDTTTNIANINDKMGIYGNCNELVDGVTCDHANAFSWCSYLDGNSGNSMHNFDDVQATGC
jgi:hypothetical protein